MLQRPGEHRTARLGVARGEARRVAGARCRVDEQVTLYTVCAPARIRHRRASSRAEGAVSQSRLAERERPWRL
jgi:hypothetical protein